MAESNREWWTDSDNVLALGSALVDEYTIHDCKSLLYFFEKPWKWDCEWQWFQARKTMEGFEDAQVVEAEEVEDE